MTASLLAIDGGTPVRATPFPAWPQYDDAERVNLMRALDQGQWWRVGGSEVTSFEEEFAAFTGAPRPDFADYHPAMTPYFADLAGKFS